MLSMTVFGSSAENRDDDLRPESAYDAYDILEDAVPGPVLPGLLQAFGVTEIVGSSKVLASSIQPAGSQELRMAWTLPRLLRLSPHDLAHFQHAIPLRCP